MGLTTDLRTRAREIPVRNAWYMLLYAWDMAEWRGVTRAAAEDAPTLLGLLARVLEQSTRQLLARQLGRAHLRRTDAIPGVRGRIDIARSLKRMEFNRGLAVCDYPELSVDTLRNRILRATLVRLSKDSRVDHVERDRGAELRRRVRDLADQMGGVALVAITSSDFSRVQLGRNDREYEVPLAICALLHRLAIPTEAAGDHALAALTRDAIEFPRLFEAFVRNFYRQHLSDCDVRSEVLQWHDDLGCALAPAMRTDVSITSRNPPYRRLVIDTKFYGSTLTETRFGGERINSGNLYQIYTYLRTQESLSEAHRVAEGILLYPTNGVDMLEAMLVQGHRIWIATVDLAEPWESIEARLRTIAIEPLVESPR